MSFGLIGLSFDYIINAEQTVRTQKRDKMIWKLQMKSADLIIHFQEYYWRSEIWVWGSWDADFTGWSFLFLSSETQKSEKQDTFYKYKC